MDTARKMLTDKNTCNFCMYYKALRNKNGIKMCKGICKATGLVVIRSKHRCKKNFRSCGQTKFDI